MSSLLDKYDDVVKEFDKLLKQKRIIDDKINDLESDVVKHRFIKLISTRKRFNDSQKNELIKFIDCCEFTKINTILDFRIAENDRVESSMTWKNNDKQVEISVNLGVTHESYCLETSDIFVDERNDSDQNKLGAYIGFQHVVLDDLLNILCNMDLYYIDQDIYHAETRDEENWDRQL